MNAVRFCQHPVTELRWRNRKVKLIGRQCLECGAAVNANWIPHFIARQECADLDELADWAEEPSTRPVESLALFGIESTFKTPDVRVDRDDYEIYLRSDTWKRRRAKILERCGGVCEGCLTERAHDVHHKTYRHYKQEFAFELIALCRACHQRIHGKDASNAA